MGNFSYKLINISDLALFLQNPRLSDSENQIESVRKMMHDQGESLIKLGSSIVADGLSPIELIGVAYDELTKKYVVLEGNRRVCALKLLNNPMLAEDKSFRIAFESLKSTFDSNPITEVNCVVFKSVSDSFKWVIKRHTGRQEGAGMVPWDPIQQDRASVNLMGKAPSIILQLIDSFERNPFFDASLKYRISEIPITNIERLINDSNVRENCGYEIENGILKEYKSKEYCGKVMSRVFSDFLPPNGLKVSDIYKSSDRRDYINDVLIQLGYIPQPEDEASVDESSMDESSQGIGAQASTSLSTSTAYEVSHETSAPKPHESSSESTDAVQRLRGVDFSNRKTLQFRGQMKPLFANSKTSQIYDEIRKLSCERYPVLVCLGIRALINGVVEECISSKIIKKEKSLSKNLIAIKLYLKTNSRSDLIDLRKLDFLAISGGDSDILDIAILHAVEHQDNITPIMNDLFSIWDRFIPVLDAMGRLIMEKRKKGI